MSSLDQFLRAYRAVRRAEGWGAADPAYYQNLPKVADNDPQRAIWRVREASYRALLQIMGANRCVLDVGAGNGWLAFQLTWDGHSVVAVDVNDDERDGLGALKNYPVALEACRADFTSLPFGEGQFDCVIFGASLHYAHDLKPVVAEAVRVLAHNGRIIVMDSPLYHDRESGSAMLAGKKRDLQERFRLEMASDSVGFLTFADFGDLATHFALDWHWIEPYVDMAWSTRHLSARLRGRREPARFGLMIGERR